MNEAAVLGAPASAGEGRITIDRAWRFVSCDRRAAELIGRQCDEIVGRLVWDVFPEVPGSEFEGPVREAMRGVATAFEVAAPDRRMRVSLAPSGDGVVVHLEEVVSEGRDELRARDGEELYRSLFNALDEGFCVIEMIFDEDDAPVDYRFVEVNPVFERHTGLRNARGRTARELVPDLEAHWFETYGAVAKTGETARFVNDSKPMDDRWFDVYAFRLGGPGSPLVAIHFTDITRRKRAEDALRYRGEQIHTLVERAPLGVYLVDADFRLVEVNPAARPVFGDVPDLIGRDFTEVVDTIWPEELAADVVRAFRHTLETGEPYHEPELAEERVDRGTTEYYDWRIDRILLPDGRFGVVCYFSDISEQVAARRAIAESEARYRTLFESIDEGFCILEVIFDERDVPVDYRFAEVNPAFERQAGVQGALGRTIRELVPDIEPFWFDVYGAVALTGEPTRYADHAASMGRWFDVYAFRIGEPAERKVAVLFNDITERKRAEEALRESESRHQHRANHDALTGLPNRHLFEDRLRLAVSAATRHERVLALLFVDLDGFKLVNDTFGHAAGDEVLEEVATRMRAALRSEDTLARLHGDEFVVLLPELSDARDAEELARSLLAEIGRPIVVAAKVVTLSASIGVSAFPRDGSDAEALLRAADVAMYRAKVGGKNDVRVFASAMRAPVVERVTLASHLAGALTRDEIGMRYQPQWDARTGSISTFEALLRWTSPELGEVPPARFVAVAEECGVFGPIASWSLGACCAFVRELSDALGTPLRIALNVAPARLAGSSFLTEVETSIARHRLDPQQLELEVGIGALLGGTESLAAMLEPLKAVGVRVVLDRFGADAGVVAPLLDLPLDGVKIEPQLVQRADRDARLRRGLAAVVGLVHDLGLDVVAVGVESESQRDVMLEIGCERLQGALIGCPVVRSEAEELLRSQPVATLF